MTAKMLPTPVRGSLHLGEALLDAEVPYRLPEEALETHFFISGGTGGGKSRLMQRFCREFLRLGRGFMIIDPHGKLVDAVLADIAERWDDLDPIQRLSIHHLKPSHKLLFSFDPFAYGPVGAAGSEEREAYLSWLESKCDRVAMQVIRQLGATGFQDTPRLERFLKATLFACGVALDDEGTHLGLDKATALINPSHRRHAPLYAQVRQALEQDEEILADFEMLRSEKRAKDQAAWNDSTLSRLRKMLRRHARQVFSQRRPSFDFPLVMRQNGIVLCDMRETPFLSKDQADFFGGLFINEMISQARRDEGEGRDQYHLLVDEAERFIGEDLRAGFGELRKMKLSLGLGFQDLSALQMGDLDLTDKVISQCGVRVTFQQQFAEHAKTLTESLCWKDLDFTPHMQKVYAPDGYEWVETESVSEARNALRTWSSSGSSSDSITGSAQVSISRSEQENESRSRSKSKNRSRSKLESLTRSHNEGENRSVGGSEAVTEAMSQTQSRTDSLGEAAGVSRGRVESDADGKSRPLLTDGGKGSRNESQSTALSIVEQATKQRAQAVSVSSAQSTAVTSGSSWNNGVTRSDGVAKSKGEGQTEGEGESEGASEGRSRGLTAAQALGLAVGRTEGTGWSEGGTEGRTEGVTRGLAPLAKHRVEYQDSGRLLRPVNDQIALKMREMMTLKRRHCLVSLADLDFTFVLRVADVVDAFADLPELRDVAVRRLKERIYTRQPYYFRPAEFLKPPAAASPSAPAAPSPFDE